MKKRIISSFTFVLGSVLLTSCMHNAYKYTLEAPVATADGITVSWSSVLGAGKYKIFNADNDQELVETKNLEYKFDNIVEETNIYVVACFEKDDFRFQNSEKSNVVKITVPVLASPVLTVIDNSVTWEAIPNASYYKLFESETNQEITKTSGLSYVCENNDSTNYSVYAVAYYKNDQLADKCSLASQSVVIPPDILSVDLSAASESFNLEIPKYVKKVTFSGSSLLNYSINVLERTDLLEIILDNADINPRIVGESMNNDGTYNYPLQISFRGTNYLRHGVNASSISFVGESDAILNIESSSTGYKNAIRTTNASITGGELVCTSNYTTPTVYVSDTLTCIKGKLTSTGCNGYNGASGNSGLSGSDGARANWGENGTNGRNGENGSNGENGGDAVSVHHLVATEEFRFNCTGGNGGYGGAGGKGGKGGNGGNAGGTEAWTGGKGGNGGNGGNGGSGGKGGYAIYCDTFEGVLKGTLQSGTSGTGGNGGNGGNGGIGGSAEGSYIIGNPCGGNGGSGGRGGNAGNTPTAFAINFNYIDDFSELEIINFVPTSYSKGGNGGNGGSGGSKNSNFWGTTGTNGTAGLGGNGGSSGNGTPGHSGSGQTGGQGS